MEFSWMNDTRRLRTLFYLVTREETTFENVKDVPDYITQVIPFFFGFILLERLFLFVRGKFELRLNDGLGSLSAGLFTETTKILCSSGIITTYVWTYNRFRIVSLPHDSAWTWWICFVGVDFGYYVFHRLSHEVNFIWASHQVHHSSEDYNLTTALRQSIWQKYFEAFIYLPLALAIPPPIFIPHVFLNNLYQFWIHTCTIGRLGFVDFILNTPSNHRVHHGRNRYCIDKNYGAVFMIWDHLFGTYEAEKDEVVYGLVSPLNNFNPFYVQFCSYIYIWNTFWNSKGLSNKLSVLFKGPGWQPGQPRLGNVEDIPDISAPVPRYDPQIGKWCKGYAFLHFAILIAAYQEFAVRHTTLGMSTLAMFSSMLFLTLFSIGAMMDKRCYFPVTEVLRCLLIALTYNQFMEPILAKRNLPSTFHQGAVLIFVISAIIWTTQCKINLSFCKTIGKKD